MGCYADPIQHWQLHRRPMVLLVEDEVLIRSAVAEYLRSEGMDVVEAASAEEAIAVVTVEAPIDLVFTDVDMPGEIDGLGFSCWLARHRPEIAVLVTSGKSLPGALRNEENCGFLAKPYRLAEALKRIHQLLQHQSA